ncbi:MAG: NnrU family protein [Gemmobacter sp.]
MDWGEYILAWAAFLGSHAVPARPPVKARIVAATGRAGYAIGYSLLSVAMLVWLIGAAGRAPHVPLWPPATWQGWLTMAAMAAACLIVALAAFRPNPHSFGGWRNERFDPARPGIAGTIRHPFLAALALWSLGHVAPNGDLAHAVMFGGFAAFALIGMRMIDRRRRRNPPPVSMPGPAPPIWHLPLRLAAACVLFLGLIALHPVAIGVPAW